MVVEEFFFEVAEEVFGDGVEGEAGTTAGNVLDRDFTAPAPNTKWVTDITEFRVGTSKIYLSPIIDLFDRSVVSYSWSTRPDQEVCR